MGQAKTTTLLPPLLLLLFTFSAIFWPASSARESPSLSPPPRPKSITATASCFDTSWITDFTNSMVSDMESGVVIDIQQPFLWTSCSPDHPTIPRDDAACEAARSAASAFHCPGMNTGEGPAKCTIPSPDPNCTVVDTTRIKDYHFGDDLGTLSDVISACMSPTMEDSLKDSAIGFGGFGRESALSIPALLSEKASFKKEFGLCFTPNEFGIMFFGENPLQFPPTPSPDLPDAYAKLAYTPLIKNPKKPDWYFIDVVGVAVDGLAIDIPKGALVIDANGQGGTELSTVAYQTQLRTDVYRPFLEAYTAALRKRGILPVPKVAGYELCIKKGIAVIPDPSNYSRKMPKVLPPVDLMLAGGKNWTVTPANHFLPTRGADCLAFADGGPRAERAVVLGGYQMTDTFMVFDLEKEQLAFNPDLLYHSIGCTFYYHAS